MKKLDDLQAPQTPAPPRTPLAPAQRIGIVPLAALTFTIFVSWSYLGWMAWGMEHMQAQAFLMPAMSAWGPVDLALVWLMWAVMMMAMMLPPAAPMLLAFAAVSARLAASRPRTHLLTFAGAYLLVWAVFSAVAALLQWWLLRVRLVSPMMASTSAALAGGLLCTAGVYQFTRWKSACLRGCRSPMAFLVRHWQAGAGGAARMGLRHGLLCVGCCWALMSLLFVLGVMNLWWIVALTLLVLAEKVLPGWRWLTNTTGAALIGWGLWLLAHAR
jgi:predicted metal-binding membrane protein